MNNIYNIYTQKVRANEYNVQPVNGFIELFTFFSSMSQSKVLCDGENLPNRVLLFYERNLHSTSAKKNLPLVKNIELINSKTPTLVNLGFLIQYSVKPLYTMASIRFDGHECLILN